jgi:hypothetical protein
MQSPGLNSREKKGDGITRGMRQTILFTMRKKEADDVVHDA